MKRFFEWFKKHKLFGCIGIILVCAIIFVTGLFVYGYNEPQNGTPGGNATDDDAGNASLKIEGGPTAARTGWMLYIVDENGSAVSPDAKLVLSSSSISIGSNVQADLNARVGGYSVGNHPADMNAPWGAPFSAGGSGRGHEVKKWMLTETGENDWNVLKVITTYWGSSMKDAFIDTKNNNYYLVLEPVYWHQMYKNSKPTGKWLIGTARGIASLQEANGVTEYGDNYIQRYTNNAYANCVKFEFEQFGLPFGFESGVLTNSQIMK